MATKKYIQPEVQVASIRLSSVILVGSAGGGSSSAPAIHSGVPTDDQW